MTRKKKDLDQQEKRTTPPVSDEASKAKQRAAELEVAGRHKNDGQNDHKGNRRQPGST